MITRRRLAFLFLLMPFAFVLLDKQRKKTKSIPLEYEQNDIIYIDGWSYSKSEQANFTK